MSPALESSSTAETAHHDIVIDEPVSQRAPSPPDLLGDQSETALPLKPRLPDSRPLPKPPTQTDQHVDKAEIRPSEDVSMS